MKQKLFTILISLAGIFFLCGCETTRSSNNGNMNYQQTAQSSSLERSVRALNARTAENARLFEEQTQKLNSMMRTLQDNNTALVTKINEMQGSISNLERHNSLLQKDIAVLKQELDNEKKTRETAMKQVVDQVAQETASAINKINTGSGSSTGNSNDGGPAGSGKFVKYRVQKGATLSAIAKAYKADVQDIKKANRLKNDIIYEGQLLYIPQK